MSISAGWAASLTNFQTINKRIKRLHELTEWTEERHARAAADARADRRGGASATSWR